jgi:hypothetical protein
MLTLFVQKKKIREKTMPIAPDWYVDGRLERMSFYIVQYMILFIRNVKIVES